MDSLFKELKNAKSDEDKTEILKNLPKPIKISNYIEEADMLSSIWFMTEVHCLGYSLEVELILF